LFSSRKGLLTDNYAVEAFRIPALAFRDSGGKTFDFPDYTRPPWSAARRKWKYSGAAAESVTLPKRIFRKEDVMLVLQFAQTFF
jgi:hypothetical protein